jgi:hypothetical protein
VSRKKVVRERVKVFDPNAVPWKQKLEAGILGTAGDAAAILNVPVGWIYTHAGEVPGFRRVGKYLRFDLRILTESRRDERGAA